MQVNVPYFESHFFISQGQGQQLVGYLIDYIREGKVIQTKYADNVPQVHAHPFDAPLRSYFRFAMLHPFKDASAMVTFARQVLLRLRPIIARVPECDEFQEHPVDSEQARRRPRALRVCFDLWRTCTNNPGLQRRATGFVLPRCVLPKLKRRAIKHVCTFNSTQYVQPTGVPYWLQALSTAAEQGWEAVLFVIGSQPAESFLKSSFGSGDGVLLFEASTKTTKSQTVQEPSREPDFLPGSCVLDAFVLHHSVYEEMLGLALAHPGMPLDGIFLRLAQVGYPVCKTAVYGRR